MKNPTIIMFWLAVAIQASGFVGASYWCANKFGDGYVALSILVISLTSWFVTYRNIEMLLSIFMGLILYGISLNFHHHIGICLIAVGAASTYLPAVEIELVERYKNRNRT